MSKFCYNYWFVPKVGIIVVVPIPPLGHMCELLIYGIIPILGRHFYHLNVSANLIWILGSCAHFWFAKWPIFWL